MSLPPPALLDRARAWAGTAHHAPSGDNSQPWDVTVATAGDRVILTLALDAATRAAPSVFDCAFSASYLALGAYARNFSLLAASEGYTLADTREAAGHFTLTFAPGAALGNPADTADLIRRRTTNRLPFQPDPLDAEAHDAFQRLAAGDGLALREFTGDEKSRLSSIFTALDRIRYRNAPLYFEFLDKLRFGAEAGRSPDGLRDTTLGVPAPSLAFLRLLRALRGVRAVRAIFFVGLDRVMAFFGCWFLINRSASVLVLSGGDDTPLGWFRLGLGFQNLWLETTRRDLALQPLGTTLLLYRLQRGDPATAFSPAEQHELRELGTRFHAAFGLDLHRPLIACRVGRAPAAANTSLRRPLVLRG